jgi:N-acetylglucosamine kinase-like BadF-type ATPase
MYLVGIDGGGTKTDCVIADLEGSVLKTVSGGPSNPRNYGIEKTGESIAKLLEESFTDFTQKNIAKAFVGIPAFAEEYGKEGEKIKEEIFKNLKEVVVLKEDVVIGSDQEVAFTCGTEKKEGVVVIAGTGSVARGWNKDKDEKTCGWGWLADTTGAFQIGQRVYQEVVKSLDGRKERSLLTKMTLDYFKEESINEINKKVYQKNHIEILSPLAIIVDKAANQEDKVAQEILLTASKELASSTTNTIKKLGFESNFPLVLVGGMFKSNLFLEVFKKEIAEKEPRAEIILPVEKPVYGALKLAKNNYLKNARKSEK